MNKKISIKLIVCYNDIDQLNQMKDTVRSDKYHVTYCFIDNRNGRFPSAAAAYNFSLRNDNRSDVLVFCHQDIRFNLESIDLIADACIREKNTLFGIAGINNNGSKNWGQTISTIAGSMMNWNYSESEKAEVEVFSLDECLIAGHYSIFDMISFDEKICDGWHLYATDFCIQCHASGIGVKVIDAKAKHLSPGHVDWAFIRAEGKLAKKYRNNYKTLSYTNGWTYTNPIKRVLLLTYRFFKYKWWQL